MTNKCDTCQQEIHLNCDWNQGRCPHVPPLINLKNFKMNIQPKDTSRGHFYVSLAKSAVRIAAGVALCLTLTPLLWYAGALLILAEVLGIVEELV
jgi:hypothetical protein